MFFLEYVSKKNEYFREKDDLMHVLNSKERKALNLYLKEVVPYRETNRWDYIVDTWNYYNPNNKINPNNISQPDYSIINEPKK